MFKRVSIVILAAGLIVALNAGSFSVLSASVALESDGIYVDKPSDSLTSSESKGLLFMYEEEKLARDVYNALFALWGQPIFHNIAGSEQMHMNAIATILVRYGLDVPASMEGVFTNPDLQALYNELMDMGSLSVLEALKVGATIEEVDILDLQERLSQTGNIDIQRVYTSLLNGSYNHLRSFTRMIEQTSGEAYQPQYLTLEQYQTILADITGSGRSAFGTASTINNSDTITNNRGFRGGR